MACNQQLPGGIQSLLLVIECRSLQTRNGSSSVYQAAVVVVQLTTSEDADTWGKATV